MKRQVLLSEVNAVGIAGKRDIRPVVDDEAAVVGPGQAARAAGELEEVPRRHGFRAQLNDLRSTVEELAQDGVGVASLGLFRIKNRVEGRENKRGHEVLTSSLS